LLRLDREVATGGECDERFPGAVKQVHGRDVGAPRRFPWLHEDLRGALRMPATAPFRGENGPREAFAGRWGKR